MNRSLIALVAAGTLVLTPAATLAKKPRPRGKDRVAAVYRDCASRGGTLKHRFPLTTLRRARRHLPADIAAYTTCDSVIAREIKRRR
jgi:hypothetical protein